MKIDHVDRAGQPDVFFVGSTLSFSDAVLGMAASNFPEINLARLNAVSDLLDADMAPPTRKLAIIVDEALLWHLSLALDHIKERFPDAIVVLAYRQARIAREVLIDQMCDATQPQISFLPMNVQFDSWLSILRLLLCGQEYLPRELFSHLSMKSSEPDVVQTNNESVDGDDLTCREREVLSLVAEGKQNKVIAAELDISEHTIKLHIHHVIAKLGVRNRTEAAIWFHANQGSEKLSA